MSSISPNGSRRTDALEFCGDAWLKRAGDVLADLVAEAGSELAGITFTGCEVFTDPPEHLRQNGEPRTFWFFRLAEGEAAVSRHDRTDVDFRVVADYAAALKTARIPYKTPPGEGGEHKTPRVLKVLFFELHNRLAEVTA